MSRLIAWVVLLAAAGLVYSLAFTPFEQFAGRWETTESGGLAEIDVVCPPPFRVLLSDAQPTSVRDKGVCELPSRTLALESLVVAIAAGLLVWKPITRPRPQSLEPLSRTMGRPTTSRSD